MPTLKLRFPGGRYHATPWGHHVNEGLVEWPPSPWRLLRALIGCGFASQHWNDVPPPARALIEKLASVLPWYRLPEITAAHTRHYMPSIEGPKQKTTLVWDTFANVGNEEIYIHWPCEITGGEAAILAALACHLNYLGRSESWVQAELIPDASPAMEKFNAVPLGIGGPRDKGHEQVSLMAPIPADDYMAWQKDQASAAVAQLETPSGKSKPSAKYLKERAKLQEPFPSDIIACLQKDTSWWKSRGWNLPPGSQRVFYWRPSQPLQVTAPRPRRRSDFQPVEMMLLALSTPSGNKSALPPVARTLPQAELFHRAVVGRVGKGCAVDCPELTGRDSDGQLLRHGHAHAHILPVDLDADGHLDHILIYARMGLGGAAQQAVRTLRRTWTKGGVGDLQLALVGHGGLEMLRQLTSGSGRPATKLFGPDAGTCVWESVTPFVPPRFLKPRGKNAIIGQINTELVSRGLPEAKSVSIDESLTRKLRHHIRRRSRGGVTPPIDIGYGVRLEFSEPVRGPLILGYASHFGLGLFAAMDTQ